jgi:hypothetical protein
MHAAQASGLIPTFHALCVRWATAAGGNLHGGGGSAVAAAAAAARSSKPSGGVGRCGDETHHAGPSCATLYAWGTRRDLLNGAGRAAAAVAHPGTRQAATLADNQADAAGAGWRATERAPFADSRFTMVLSNVPGSAERAADQPTAAGRAVQRLVNAGSEFQDPIRDAAAVPVADTRVERAVGLIQGAGLRWAKRRPAGSVAEPGDDKEVGGGRRARRAWGRGRARAAAAALLMRGTHSHGVQAAVRGWIAARLVKNPARAAAKAVGCYEGDVSRLLDVCRARATFGSVDALAACVRAAAEAPGVRVVRVKNLMRELGDSWWTGGFRVSLDWAEGGCQDWFEW